MGTDGPTDPLAFAEFIEKINIDGNKDVDAILTLDK
jgi:hypothetical protein